MTCHLLEHNDFRRICDTPFSIGAFQIKMCNRLLRSLLTLLSSSSTRSLRSRFHAGFVGVSRDFLAN
jgi:hypothetical protein